MDYTELKEAVVRWLNRVGFSDLIDEVDTLLIFAQNRIARECDLNAMELVAQLTMSVPTVPDDLKRVKTVTGRQGPHSWNISGTNYQKVIQAGSNSAPLYYTIINTEFVFGPAPDQDYNFTVVYYGQLPNLSDQAPSNWISENVPELILFAALLEACLFLKDDQRGAVWAARYDEVKKSLTDSEERMSLESGGLRAREQQFRYEGNRTAY